MLKFGTKEQAEAELAILVTKELKSFCPIIKNNCKFQCKSFSKGAISGPVRRGAKFNPDTNKYEDRNPIWYVNRPGCNNAIINGSIFMETE